MITYAKTIPLKHKIYTWNDILDILEIIEKQVTTRDVQDKFDIYIECDDGFKINYNNVTEIKQHKIITNYVITYIGASLRTSTFNILFRLDSAVEYASEIIIESSDEVLFHALLNQFNEKIKNLIPQKYIFVHVHPTLTLIMLIILNIASLSLSWWVIFRNISKTVIMLIFIIMMLISMGEIELLQKSYPEVEFDFIRDDKSFFKKYRNLTKYIWGSVILPFLISFFVEFIKYVVSIYGG